MSIRQWANELRPLYRVLDEVVSGSPAPFSRLSRRPFFDDPSFNNMGFTRSPAVNISVKGNKYLLEAELPGMKKEDVQIRIENDGRSVTIEGNSVYTKAPAADKTATESPSDSKETVKAEASKEISTESTFTRSTSFTRTVWLPHAVDADKASATLEDGVLTLTIPKADDKASKTISIQ